MNLPEVCRQHGGRELRGRNAYEFSTAREMLSAVASIGFALELPESLWHRRAKISVSRNKKPVAEIAYQAGDSLPDWCLDNDDRPKWAYRVLDARIDDTTAPQDLDDRIRRAAVDDANAGWWLAADSGQWMRVSPGEIKNVLMSLGHSRGESDIAMGLMVRRPWQLICAPFGATEDAAKRTWNVNAPQLRHTPSPGEHPHWDRILGHVGRELNEPIQSSDWARDNGITSGRDYLRAWIACIIRHPECRLPYLFLHGTEDCGKSILHEAIAECLFTRGVVRADRALTNRNDFNGELLSAILCIVEEKDISQTAGALAKIKDAVTSLTLSIRKMRTDAYQVPNMTHWIQTANTIDACPIGWGDTRIVAIHVRPLEHTIPKDALLAALAAEAPAFTQTLLSMPLPKIKGRLALQVVETQSKALASDRSTPELLHAVAELPRPWQGTAGQLADALGRGNWPRDFRAVQRTLEAHRAFLRQRGIIATYPGRTKAGQQIRLGETWTTCGST